MVKWFHSRRTADYRIVRRCFGGCRFHTHSFKYRYRWSDLLPEIGLFDAVFARADQISALFLIRAAAVVKHIKICVPLWHLGRRAALSRCIRCMLIYSIYDGMASGRH